MSSAQSRILLVDDDAASAERLRHVLARAGPDPLHVEAVGSLGAALDRLPEGWDAVVAELNLPDSQGAATVKRLLAEAGPTPVIVLTQALDEDLGRECVELGAQDCLAKREADDARLGRAVRYAVERKRILEQLRDREHYYRSLYTSMSEGVCLHEIVRDADGVAANYRIVDVNPAYESLTGMSRDDAVGRLATEAYGTPHPPFLDIYARVEETGQPTAFETYWAPMGKHFAISAFRPDPGMFATVFADITARKQAEDSLREGQRWNQTILDGMPGAAMLLRAGTRDIVAANRHAREAGAVPGARCARDRLDPDGPCAWCLRDEVWETRAEQRAEFEAGGSVYDAYWCPLGEDMYLYFVFDVTEQRRLEQRLRQAAKMESVGRLAGGVAHDFNNLLTTIMGNVDLNLADVEEGSQLHSDLLQVKQAAKRAADLTRQLLTFSRQQTNTERRTFDLNDALRNIVDMLRHVIPENIGVSLETPLVPVLLDGDQTQVEQIVMNLAVNARDAMPQGGRLGIRSEEVVLSTGKAGALGLGPGPYAVLAVSDTGAGLSPEVRERMFEPFFTTKEAGRGTGLGLATVYGIVKDHGGAVDCQSQVGEGTTFGVYLPLSRSAATDYSERSEYTPVETAGEVILLVEDEETLRDLMQRVLMDSGFRVVAAPGGEQAVGMLTEGGLQLDLLLTDIVMPGMDGRELAAQVKELRPGAKVLVVSGYAGDDGSVAGGGPIRFPLLRKPFTRRELVMTVRSVLDQS